MIDCRYCGEKREDHSGFLKKFCDGCIKDKEIGSIRISTSIFVNPGDGRRIKTSKAEIDEIKRLRVLPYNKPGGGWYPGRVNDSGKIEERYLKN